MWAYGRNVDSCFVIATFIAVLSGPMITTTWRDYFLYVTCLRFVIFFCSAYARYRGTWVRRKPGKKCAGSPFRTGSTALLPRHVCMKWRGQLYELFLRCYLLFSFRNRMIKCLNSQVCFNFLFCDKVKVDKPTSITLILKSVIILEPTFQQHSVIEYFSIP